MSALDEPTQSGIATYVSLRSRAVQAIRSPLGFFVLALLIVESFLFGTGTLFGLPGPWKIAAIGVGVLLFLVVFAAVVWLVIKYPKNLVFNAESHIQFAAMRMYGSEIHLITGQALDVLPSQPTPNATAGQLPGPDRGS